MSARIRWSAWAAVLGLGLAAAAAAPAPASAQYFGRNKVQYRTFDFRVLKTPRFDIYYYPEEEVAVRDAARMAERWYARLSRVLDHEFEDKQDLILYAAHPHFQQTATLGSDIGESTGGFTEVFKRRIVLPLAHSYAETDHVVGHELVHAFQYDMSGIGQGGAGLESALQRTYTPLWFSEGMAEYLTIGPVDAHTSMWLRDAALTGQVPTIADLTRNPSYFPYRWGHAFWAYVGGRWGDAAIGQILKQVGQGVPYPEAFQRILNMPLEEIGEDWALSIRRTYLPLLTDRREAREQARALITNKKAGGEVNLSPSLSPDGNRLIFLSELNFLDIELFVADARTGEVQRRLVKGSSFDPHFGSLRYISSAGTWSPDGERFAFSALRKAQDEIVVMDVDRARILREYRIPGVIEISNPTWSPDGRTLVFSGLTGGMTDLWTLDLESGDARKLTDDRYADLHPAFSPDGRTLAFVTDRGEDANLDQLDYGTYKVAFMDVATGAIRTAPGMAGPNNINPQWTADGAGVFFVSNRSGIPNVYRLDVASGALTQVTNLFTGVSGITALSPALTSASKANRIVFTAYERNFGFNIYMMDTPEQLAGSQPPPSQAEADAQRVAAILPPSPRPTEPAFNRVATLLANEEYGLPPLGSDTAWRVVPYRPRLTLDYLGQPQVGVSTGGGIYGRGGLYGGISTIFSDVLGRHTVYGTVQAQGQLDEIGFSTVYLNQRSRFNYGVAAQRVPYIAGVGRTTELDEDGNLLDQLRIFRYFDTQLAALAQYPFSNVQRLQFELGGRRISQDQQIREYVYVPVGDTYEGPVDYRERDADGRAYNFLEGSAAWIYDSSLMGYVSPFSGQRFHFEIAPTFGSGEFVEAIADYRKYFFLRPMTVAFRGLHFGRYGKDERLFGDQFLGYSYFMRGYSYNNVRDECVETNDAEGTECRIFDELFGSRLAVVNAELRVPLLSRLIGTAGLSPLEGIAFFDAGVAWGEVTGAFSGEEFSTSPVFRRGLQDDITERGILTSAGVGGRFNLFGYVVVEGVYVNAFERDRGWHWQFSFQPGF
jgi:Tol biopolymer transport system component